VNAPELAADVANALAARIDEICTDVYDLIMREIPGLPTDSRVRSLLSASVVENVSAALHILQHAIDVDQVRAPNAAEAYARRLAQWEVPMAALLRSYRIGATRFQAFCLRELDARTSDAALAGAAALRIVEIVGAYIDRVSEEVVAVYQTELGDWRNLGAARASRVHSLLDGDGTDVSAAEALLGYRLRQRHVGVVCWAERAEYGDGTLARLESATAALARRAGCTGRPMFVPQDESGAWAWLPLGATTATIVPDGPDDGVRFALGAPGSGLSGFRRTHRQALATQAVALAAGPGARPITGFDEVAPLALMAGSLEMLREWVGETLGALADDDEPAARLRETLRVFLAENGSYKATAERLTLHKNTVQYRIGRAREGLGRPIEDNRLYVELALLAGDRLGAAVLRRPAPGNG